MYKKWIWIASLVLLALACNIPTFSGSPSAPEANTPGDSQSTSDNPADQPALPFLGGSAQNGGASDQPVPLRQGLASLDSYTMVMENTTSGPTPDVETSTRAEISWNAANDAFMMKNINSIRSADDPEPIQTEESQYLIGLESCSSSEGEWSFYTSEPIEKEVRDTFSGLMDYQLVMQNPQYEGAETVNGIESDHYTFQLSGLGVDSGSQVTRNEGEYWLAVDGRYLVKYMLSIEMSSTPEEVYQLVVNVELTSVNQPIEITFPQACLDAKANMESSSP